MSLPVRGGGGYPSGLPLISNIFANWKSYTNGLKLSMSTAWADQLDLFDGGKNLVLVCPLKRASLTRLSWDICRKYELT
jgi:hypothetical protein